MREIIERLIAKSGQTHLDADAVALGLIGVLEMLWQDFAFKDEQDIDRAAARERAMAYLRSVFPDQFLASSGPVPGGGAEGLLSARAYHDAHLYALEREHVFQNSWQFAAHGAELQAPGCFVSTDLGFERVLVVRDAGRRLRAFRNSCPAAPHALVAPGDGRQQVLRCAVHGLAFGLDGKALAGTADLLALEVRQVGEWVLVRAADRAHRAAFADHWHKLDIAPGARPLPALADTPVAADWKVVAELFLGVQGLGPQEGWSAEHYRRLTRHTADASGTLFLAPNHWVGLRPDGWTLRQVLPIAPGRCALRQYRYSWCEDEAMARAAQYLADRSSRIGRAAALQVAESIQHGLVMLGHRSAQERSPEVSAFHRQLISVLPMLGLPAGMEGSEDL